MAREELGAWLRLTLTPGVGNATARRLMAAFGPPDVVFAQSAAALGQVVGERQAQALLATPDGLAPLLERTWAWLAESPADGFAHRIITLGDPDYPTGLLAIEDPPLMLYLLGQARPGVLEGEPLRALAMVGSRNPTPQGLLNAQQFARALAGAGLTVVSGLALGVDGAAHEGALEGAPPGQLATIAVVGTGLDRVYPARHRELARRIAQQGLLVSEYPMGTPPLAANFPKRNRIIAGLSLGTLVVEAALESGSLITARLANEQGREVFAIPGSIHASQSRGCHALIRQGAKLVESAADVLEELNLDGVVPPGPAATAPSEGSESDDAGLLQQMGHDPVSLDALQARTGLDTATLLARLLTLELGGVVGRLPGGLYQRLAAA